MRARPLTYLLALPLLPLAQGCSAQPLTQAQLEKALQQDDAGVPQAVALIPAASVQPEPDPQAWVLVHRPAQAQALTNPVTVLFEAGQSVRTVLMQLDGQLLTPEPIQADQQQLRITGAELDTEHDLVVLGLDESGSVIAQDQVRFTLVHYPCAVPDQPGFNHYTVSVINNQRRYPRNDTYPYCWGRKSTEPCKGRWGMIHDASYGGSVLFEGGKDCFCSGHTLEVFLQAYREWQKEQGLEARVPFQVKGRTLTPVSVAPGPKGVFYQYWQGFGPIREASSARAFTELGIGLSIPRYRWAEARPGDFVNFQRTNGSGHAALFVHWIREHNQVVGLRYYSCNHKGDSCPESSDVQNQSGISGPSFQTEYFQGYRSGSIVPDSLQLGRPLSPTTLRSSRR